FEIFDPLSLGVVGCGRCEDLVCRLDELEFPSTDDGIGELMLAAQFRRGGFASQGRQRNFGLELGRIFPRLRHDDDSSSSVYFHSPTRPVFGAQYTRRVEVLSRFASDYAGRARCLFACRTNDFSPTFTHRQVILLAFGYGQVREYIRLNFRMPITIE